MFESTTHGDYDTSQDNMQIAEDMDVKEKDWKVRHPGGGCGFHCRRQRSMARDTKYALRAAAQH